MLKMRPIEKPHSQQQWPSPQASQKVPSLCIFIASLAIGCTQGLVDAKPKENTPLEDTNPPVRPEDTGMDSAEPTDTNSTDTASTECEPNNTSPWPTTGSEIGEPFREHGGSELSGITGIPGETIDAAPLAIYGVGDGGVLYHLGGTGEWIAGFTLPTPEDLEGIGIDSTIDPTIVELFTIDEDTSDVDGWNWIAGTDPTKTSTDCVLNMPTDIPNNLGLEGFTYLPVSEAPEAWAGESWADARGYFLAGSQSHTEIGVFPVTACTSDAILEPVLSLPSSSNDIAGLSSLLGNLYVLHDSSNTVDIINMGNRTLVETHTLPTVGQEEGLWLNLKSCDPTSGYAEMFVADDVSGEVWVYDIPLASTSTHK